MNEEKNDTPELKIFKDEVGNSGKKSDEQQKKRRYLKSKDVTEEDLKKLRY